MRIRLKTKDGKKIEGTVTRKDDNTLEVSYGGKKFIFKVQKTPLGDFIIEDEKGEKHKLSRIFSSKYERVFEINGYPVISEIVSAESGAGEEESQEVSLIKSSFSGLVKKIYVKKGEKVRKGQPVLDLESMKMVNTIKSPVDGVIEDIYVSEGKNVMSAEKLVKIKKE